MLFENKPYWQRYIYLNSEIMNVYIRNYCLYLPVKIQYSQEYTRDYSYTCFYHHNFFFTMIIFSFTFSLSYFHCFTYLYYFSITLNYCIGLKPFMIINDS